MGFDHPFTLYAAWYDGVSNHACGGGHGLTAWHRLPMNRCPDIWPRCTSGAPSTT
jgi:hypothetical protein